MHRFVSSAFASSRTLAPRLFGGSHAVRCCGIRHRWRACPGDLFGRHRIVYWGAIAQHVSKLLRSHQDTSIRTHLRSSMVPCTKLYFCYVVVLLNNKERGFTRKMLMADRRIPVCLRRWRARKRPPMGPARALSKLVRCERAWPRPLGIAVASGCHTNYDAHGHRLLECVAHHKFFLSS